TTQRAPKLFPKPASSYRLPPARPPRPPPPRRSPLAGLGAGIAPGASVRKRRYSREAFSLIALALMIALVAIPSFAGPVPSKTAANQSLESRAADLALVRDVAANEQVAQVLAAHGFTQEQVNQRLAQLSPQDLHQLAQNLDQLQAAGLTQQQWIWIGIGALAVLILVVALH